MQLVSTTTTDRPVLRHVTDSLAMLPESVVALREFHVRKREGLFPTDRKSSRKMGDMHTFKVFNLETGQFERIDFKLVSIDQDSPSRFQIWAEIAEMESGNITQEIVDSLAIGLGRRTPVRSFNPLAGIIENDEAIFGEPPDVDGDGITDVLVMDIRDGYGETQTTSYVGGFVTAYDLSSTGNLADILYLDIYPTLRQIGIPGIKQIATHEYQHLIMMNYDTEELTFVNEGLSEWAELALGYYGRSIRYLRDPDGYQVPLFKYDPTDWSFDRQRGLLFISYIADRFGKLGPGEITRSPFNGSQGLRDALREIDGDVELEDLIFDFHVANVLNDHRLDPLYGYSSPEHSRLKATPGAIVDGEYILESPLERVILEEGAVVYRQWNSVANFTLTVGDDRQRPSSRNIRADVFLFGEDGSLDRSVMLDSDGVAQTFEGYYGRVILVIVNTNPEMGRGSIDVAASWGSQQDDHTLDVVYDSGQVAGSDLFFSLADGAGMHATRFVTPRTASGRTEIDRIWLGHYYISQFADQPAVNEPRDFTLHVWAQAGARNGPGQVLFEKPIADSREYKRTTSTILEHMEIDMSPYVAELDPLPDTLYIGIGESGSDANFVVMGPSRSSSGDVSFVFSEGVWEALWDIQFDHLGPAIFPLRGTVIPTRVRFFIHGTTSSKPAVESPQRFSLFQNYPNPFNPTTTISYHIGIAGQVRLAIHDLIGREVVELVNGLRAPGLHSVTVNGEKWPSGVYTYSLENGEDLTRMKMVLLK